MEAYAVIETGGKQYRVLKGSVLEVDRLEVKDGDKFVFSSVLAVSDGKELKIGTPVVQGATVIGDVVKNLRGTKVISFKKKRRKGYHKKIGHRQELTQVTISEIKG